MYRCTCIICGKTFHLDHPYDVCSISCEAARWEVNKDQPADQKGYVPSRDDMKVKPVKLVGNGGK